AGLAGHWPGHGEARPDHHGNGRGDPMGPPAVAGPARELPAERKGSSSVDVAGEPPTVDGPLLVFCNSAHWIYGHWLMDCLPGIVTFRDELRCGRLAALAPPLRDWQRECLIRIGVAAAIHEVPNLVVRVRDLILPSFVDV